MGLESSNYLFVFSEDKRSNEVIEHLHLKVMLTDQEMIKCVKLGNNYWIDFLLNYPQTRDVSIRIALCNPYQAMLELKQALQVLFLLDVNGFLLDRDSKKKYVASEEYMWDGIMTSYEKRKSLFKEIYGDVELAVSAEEFYHQIRKE